MILQNTPKAKQLYFTNYEIDKSLNWCYNLLTAIESQPNDLYLLREYSNYD